MGQRELLVSLAALLAIGAALAVLWPVYTGGHSHARTACLSNVKQIGTGMLLYAYDYDERLPDADWEAGLADYVKNREIFRCPVAKQRDPESQAGYAMNAFLIRAKISGSDELTLAFESDHPRPNALATQVRPLADDRHEGKLNVLFTDGHAKAWLNPKLASLKMRP